MWPTLSKDVGTSQPSGSSLCHTHCPSVPQVEAALYSGKGLHVSDAVWLARQSRHLEDVVSREIAVVQRELIRNDWHVAVCKLLGYML